MKYILSLCFLLAAATATAQNKTQQVFYFKNDGSRVAVADSSDYIRIVSLPDSGSTLFGITDYYRNGKPKLMGKSSTIDPPVFEEQCVSFYANGKRESVFNYDKGVTAGPAYLFYPNGKLHVSLTYDTIPNQTAEQNVRIISCLDSAGKTLATDGNGQYIDYNFATNTVSEQGAVKDGKPDGEWHGNYAAEKVTYTDTYRDGKLISGFCVTENGTRYTYTSRRQSPEFKGGEAAFLALIKKKFKYPATLKSKSTSGVLTFLIDKTGKVSQARFLGNITPEINKIIIDAVNASPNWTPAIQNGMPVATTWLITATFGTPPATVKATK